MINKIKLTNFQAHIESELNLTPGINTITGQSDNGKSSILRAVNYLLYNRPSSNNYMNHNTDNMEIEVTAGDNTIARYRNKTENGYKINGKTLKAIGQEVPEEVNILNLSSVNIQKQLDSHFLLSSTAGEVAKYLNKIVKLDSIDFCLSEIESMKRQTNRDIKQLKDQKEWREIELKAYENIEKAQSLLNKLKTYEDKINTNNSDMQLLNDLIIEYSKIEKQLNNIPDIEKANKLLVELQEIQEDINNISIKENTLQETISNYPDHIPELNVEKANSYIELLEKLNNEIIEYYNKESYLDNSIIELKEIEQELKTNSKELKELNKQLPDICPLCNQKIKGE